MGRFSNFKKSVLEEDSFSLESPLTFLLLFYKGENQVRTKNPNDSSVEKAIYEN